MMSLDVLGYINYSLRLFKYRKNKLLPENIRIWQQLGIISLVIIPPLNRRLSKIYLNILLNHSEIIII